MLPKSERLTKQDFTLGRPKIFFRGEIFDIGYLLLPSQKFACVISKKTLSQAVMRNSIKRKIFNIVYTLRPETRYSIIFYPKKISYQTPYSQLQEEIKKAFDTLH